LGYYLDEAAQEIADQQGEDVPWARSFHKHMLKAAALPEGAPNRLKVRDTKTGLINPDGAKFSHIALVRHADVNEWLQAGGESYCWKLHIESVASQPKETPKQRRERWLGWIGDGERGAVTAVYQRELKVNPKADRSYIGKQIKRAREEKAALLRTNAYTSQLIKDGKRKG
jgi:hypothetical protein